MMELRFYIIKSLVFSMIVILEDYTTYGRLGNLESNIKEILVIILPSLRGRPEARVITFRNHSDGFNRLYFFNAMQNLVHPNKGK